VFVHTLHGVVFTRLSVDLSMFLLMIRRVNFIHVSIVVDSCSNTCTIALNYILLRQLSH